MNIACPHCQSLLARKKSIYSCGKAEILMCLLLKSNSLKILRTQLFLTIRRKECVDLSYRERVSLEGICRIFDVSHALAARIHGGNGFKALPDNLNAHIVAENSEFEVVVLEADEMWNFVGKRSNDQWLLAYYAFKNQTGFSLSRWETQQRVFGQALMN